MAVNLIMGILVMIINPCQEMTRMIFPPMRRRLTPCRLPIVCHPHPLRQRQLPLLKWHLNQWKKFRKYLHINLLPLCLIWYTNWSVTHFFWFAGLQMMYLSNLQHPSNIKYPMTVNLTLVPQALMIKANKLDVHLQIRARNWKEICLVCIRIFIFPIYASKYLRMRSNLPSCLWPVIDIIIIL